MEAMYTGHFEELRLARQGCNVFLVYVPLKHSVMTQWLRGYDEL